VTIGVLTYRRPEDLAALLPLLVAQAGEQLPGYQVDIVVVDNDPAGSARSVPALGDPRVRYVVEPQPGIAAARNRVLTEAAGSDLLVFIDDDERPHPGWLAHLLATHERTGAALVAGAVVSDFAHEPDAYLRAGDFFRRRRLRTGTPLTVAATNNLLLDLHVVRHLGLRFDPRFGLSGGEDTLFTRRLGRSGAGMVWCDEAVVTDAVPASRLTRSWVLARALSSGNSVARVELALADGWLSRARTRAVVSGAGFPRLVGGAARWGLGAATGSLTHRAKGLRTAARGAGMVLGALGVVHLEYRREPGGRRLGQVLRGRRRRTAAR
jgi:GT2 family glycosyltransferase